MIRRSRLAKLTRPKLRHALDRHRLYALLDEARLRSVVWLTGAPGAGKTTLVSTWLEVRKHRYLWYSLDAGDRDPASWFLHVRENAIGISTRHSRLPLYTTDFASASDVFARRFFRELYRGLPPHCVLVFDDYHVIPPNSPFHALFAIACEEVPDDLILIVISREDPPPGLALLQARERLRVIDGKVLDLTSDEARAIAMLRGRDLREEIAELHRASKGWAAGFTLMLDAPKDRLMADLEQASREAVFGYFAGTVLDRLDERDRTSLQELALLPRFTLDMARRTAKRPSLVALIESMRQRRLFVYASGPWREFHALFREYLCLRVRTEFSPQRRRQALRRAANLLEQEGLGDEALALHLQAGDWAQAEILLRRDAERMIAEGRWRSLLAHLDQVPAEYIEASGWLSYWRGRARQSQDPVGARDDLTFAADRFALAGEGTGEALALAASLQLELATDHDHTNLKGAFLRLDRAVASVKVWPSQDQEATVLGASMFGAQYFNPSHPAIRTMAVRVVELVDVGEGTSARAHCAVQALIYLVTVGEFELARRLVNVLQRMAIDMKTSASDRVFSLTYIGLAQYLLFLQFDDALGSIKEGRRLAIEHGLHWAEMPLLQFEAEIHLYTNRDPVAGRAVLDRMRACGLNPSSVAAVFYHGAAAQAESWSGNKALAYKHAQSGLDAARAMSPGFFLVFGRWFVHTYVDGGDLDGAHALLSEVEAGLEGTCFEKSSRPVVALQRAYLSLARGDRPRAHELIKRALTIMEADPSSEASVYWMGRALPIVLEESLRTGLAGDYARDLIRRIGLPPAGRVGFEWPWPVSVRTLGVFELRRYGEIVPFGRKIPRKTLALLKALIAFGGAEVRESRLIDALWPDEEGDAAHGAYTMAVVRLRRLLGDSKVLVQRGRTLSLDRTRCHVDLWEMEVSPQLDGVPGEFLPDDDDAAWAEPVRQRLRRAAKRQEALGHSR